MKRKAGTSQAAARGASRPAPAVTFVPPYQPSWVDRLTTWVDRLPGPYWLAYLVVGLASVALAAVLLELEGGSLSPVVVYSHAIPCYGF